DDGNEGSFARNLFRDSAAFLCVNADSVGYADLVGAPRFRVLYQARPDGENEVTKEFQETLEPYLPYLTAALARVTVGGGVPVDFDDEKLRRLQSLRFYRCE